MHLRYFTLLGSLSAFAVGGALLGPARVAAQETEGVEELTRGPVHEAFAETVSYEAEAGALVSAAPPAAIEEIPPDSRPEGDNVSWIPGYWAWDDDQNDYLWISGIWRNLPPGREWVPGYWNETQSQYQWISGYWADSSAEEVTYLPAPPKSVEAGPNIAAPDDNHSWIPGSWVYRDERYNWRPGYWEPVQENWVVVPSHYNWTPRGYVYIDSYYDYSVARRGVIFAPVRFSREVYVRPNYYYTPLTVISLNVFASHLFVRPSHCHYYFGDYYEPRYRDRGFFASFSYSSGRRGYDPFYAHNRWQHRGDRDWDNRRRDDFNFYRDNADARPPRTWAALRARGEDDRRGRRDDFVLAESLGRRVENRDGRGEDSRQRFVSVNKETRDKIVVERKEVNKFRDERKKLETRDGDRSGPRIQASREKFAKSPVVSRKIEDLAKDEAPPKRRERETREGDLPKSTGRGTEDGKAGPNGPDADKSARGDQKQKDLPDGVRRGQGGPEGANDENRDNKVRGTGPTNRANDSKDLPANGRQGQMKDRDKTPETGAARDNKKADGGVAPGETPKARPDGDTTPRPGRQAAPEPENKARSEPQTRERQAETDTKPKIKEQARQVIPRQTEQEQTRRSAPTREIQRQQAPEPRKQAAPKPQQAPEARAPRQPEVQRQVRPQPEAQRQAPRQPEVQRQARPQPEAQRQVRPQPEVQRQARPQPEAQRQVRPQPERQQQAQPRQKAQAPRETAQPRQNKKNAEDEGKGKSGR